MLKFAIDYVIAQRVLAVVILIDVKVCQFAVLCLKWKDLSQHNLFTVCFGSYIFGLLQLHRRARHKILGVLCDVNLECPL